MKTTIRIIFTFLLGLIMQPAFASGGGSPVNEITEHLKSFTSFSQPHKVYLHLDKSGYQAGETIWFKVYLFDGVSHMPDNDTTNVFVELINSDGKAMDMKILLADDGFAKGEIELSSELPDGNYVLRAYTGWMRNFSEDYFFTQYLYIENKDYENMIPRIDVLKNRVFNWRLNRRTNNHEVAFFPEGGDLLAGTNNRVAFKVVDMLGRGQDAKGEITDGSGTVVASFRTGFSGIGVFEIKPEPGQSYSASVSVDGGRHSTYDFPDVLYEGYSLRIDQNDGKIDVRIMSTLKQDDPLYSKQLILIANSRGMPQFGNSFSVSDSKIETSIDKSLFSSGIVQFTLFTENYIPVAERLIFVDNDDQLTFSPQINALNLDGQDYIDLQITISDHRGNPVAGNFSFSAVTGQENPDFQNKDILSYLLLSSDLKEMIIDPYVYLQEDADITADHLLLTYGWRRFEWDKVLAGELPDISIPPLTGLAIAGRLLDPANNEPLNNHPVKLIVRSGHDDVYETQTGRRGFFAFPGLFYEGVVEVELSSSRLPRGYPPEFDLNIKSGKDYDYDLNAYTQKRRVTSRGDDWERVRGISSTPYRSSLERRRAPQMYGNPTQTIYIDHDRLTETNLFEVLRNNASSSLMIQGEQILIRGQSSLTQRNEPRYMLDGTFVDRSHFLRLNPTNIERIEIFTGPSAAIFGSRGGTGVILAYSRRADHRGFEDVTRLAIMGYHSPGEFYHDRLPDSVIESRKELPETTVHWEPELISAQNGRLNIRFPVYEGLDNLKLTLEGTGLEGGIGFMGFILDINE